MITKNDCLLLLTDIESFPNVNKDEVTLITRKLLSSSTIPLDVLKYINSIRPLEVSRFYEQLRINYNHKKSKLYKNIVKEIDDTPEVLTTLSSLLTQILLFSKNCENKLMFFQHTRAKEISLCLSKYFEDSNITICLQLLRLIKADLKSLEELKNI